MSASSRFLILLTLALVLPVSAQGGRRLTINPKETTIHIGQKQFFKAVVENGVQIRWKVQEPDGGRITEHGIYTAPRHLGRYHVIAISENNQAVAIVTVVTEADTSGGKYKY